MGCYGRSGQAFAASGLIIPQIHPKRGDHSCHHALNWLARGAAIPGLHRAMRWECSFCIRMTRAVPQQNVLNSCYSIYQHSFQFTPTGSGHTGTFNLTPTFYPLEKGLPCQTGPSLTGNFLLGFPQSLQVGLCLGHVSLCILSIIKPKSGENSRLFPRILSPNKHQWL